MTSVHREISRDEPGPPSRRAGAARSTIRTLNSTRRLFEGSVMLLGVQSYCVAKYSAAIGAARDDQKKDFAAQGSALQRLINTITELHNTRQLRRFRVWRMHPHKPGRGRILPLLSRRRAYSLRPCE